MYLQKKQQKEIDDFEDLIDNFDKKENYALNYNKKRLQTMLKKDKEKPLVAADLASVEEIEEEDFENSVQAYDNIIKSAKKDKMMVKKVKMSNLPSESMLDPILEDQRNLTNVSIDQDRRDNFVERINAVRSIEEFYFRIKQKRAGRTLRE
jgi:hypothetical protein